MKPKGRNHDNEMDNHDLVGERLCSRRRIGLAPPANTAPAPATPRSSSATLMPYSGPASSYGTIGKSDAAYFAMINDQGGINGRKINFISRDDAYSPPKTVEQIRQLVEQDQVLADFQYARHAAQLRDPAAI